MKQLVLFPVIAVTTFFNVECYKVKETLSDGEPLILTPFIEAGQFEQAKTQALVNYPDFKDIVCYSGYLQVDKELNNNLFFYFFPSEDNYQVDPVLVWLQGGLGTPASYAVFLGNGPFVINSDYSVDLREYRWTKNHSVLYIDSPVGTGFSFTTKNGYAQNQAKIGDDLYNALIQFFTLFSEFQANDLYIVGEYYGGKHAPALGYAIFENNPSASLQINLKGIAIGNGLSDPVNQANYGDYLYQLGFVDIKTRDKLHESMQKVENFTEDGNWTLATQYFYDNMTTVIQEATRISRFNYLQLDPDEYDYWLDYIQEEVTRDALHVGTTDFKLGNELIWENLYDDIAKSVAPLIGELLSHYRFLIYSGQVDIVVPYPGTVNYLQKLNISTAGEYKFAARYVWRDVDGIVGYYKNAGNLTELLVRNAGHMVPKDQPKRGYMMIYSFVRDLIFIKNI